MSYWLFNPPQPTAAETHGGLTRAERRLAPGAGGIQTVGGILGGAPSVPDRYRVTFTSGGADSERFVTISRGEIVLKRVFHIPWLTSAKTDGVDTFFVEPMPILYRAGFLMEFNKKPNYEWFFGWNVSPAGAFLPSPQWALFAQPNDLNAFLKKKFIYTNFERGGGVPNLFNPLSLNDFTDVFSYEPGAIGAPPKIRVGKVNLDGDALDINGLLFPRPVSIEPHIP